MARSKDLFLAPADAAHAVALASTHCTSVTLDRGATNQVHTHGSYS